jgi:hypothetical protein
MVDVGRDDKPVFIVTKIGRQSGEFVEAVTIDSERQWHNG